MDCPKEDEDDMTQSPRVRKNKDGTYEVIHLDEEGEPILAHDGSYNCIPAFKPEEMQGRTFLQRKKDGTAARFRALEDMKKNVSNNYAWLLRERAVNLAAQDELLDTIDMEEALPKEILAVLARAANVPEMTSLIELLKDGKAPGPEGAIAEMLKANKTEWVNGLPC